MARGQVSAASNLAYPPTQSADSTDNSEWMNARFFSVYIQYYLYYADKSEKVQEGM